MPVNKTDKHRRDYDVMLWGATGFTGRLVAEYLLAQYGTDGELRWAIAGRDQAKLERIGRDIGISPDALDITIADSHDAASMDRLASATQVVISTVGPYAKHGTRLVEACARNGTHYCDLSGEVQWMRKMIDSYQQEAEASGARIVHSCGFDSIPSDIGVWFLQSEAKRRTGAACSEIKLLVKAMRGGASGGTFASMMNAVEEGRRDRDVARIFADPYSLNPSSERQGPDAGEQTGIKFCDMTSAWTAPFVMASVNTRIVRRTNALLGYPYGRDFRYSESTLTGSGVSGWLKSAGMTASLGGFMLACAFTPGRAVLKGSLLPKPGDGPSREQREAGFFNLLLVGKLADGSQLRARVTGDRDPGYGSTSKMLGESAACLALDDIELQGGFWTPASAMGDALLQRLQRNAGLTFDLIP